MRPIAHYEKVQTLEIGKGEIQKVKHRGHFRAEKNILYNIIIVLYNPWHYISSETIELCITKSES